MHFLLTITFFYNIFFKILQLYEILQVFFFFQYNSTPILTCFQIYNLKVIDICSF